MLQYFVQMQVWMACRKKQKGQSLAEYGLILALIAVVCIAALTLMGNNIRTMLNGLAGTIKSVPTAP
ncbi:MAG TPA: Flp family type IVb pilin [Coleofasciculaceae cyanobacterium]|jgi:pilus assembly protein Flp/PilA